MTTTLSRQAPTAGTLVPECRMCGIAYPSGFVARCELCNGATDVFYRLDRAVIGDFDVDPLNRYRDLLPIVDRDNLVWAGEGDTPLVHALELGGRYGLRRLYLKVEGSNPTGSAKDRMAAVALPFLRERGVGEFTVSSTGNSSTSFGVRAALFPDLRLHIFCGASFHHRLNFPDQPNVTVYTVDGSFVQAGKCAQEYAARRGLPFEAGFFNLARREGLKLAYLEAVDQMPVAPAVVIQAISSGMGIYGAYKGFREYLALGRLPRLPRIVCAQQLSCAPMYQGWKDGVARLDASYRIAEPRGLAQAILRGDSSGTYPYLHRIVTSVDGFFTAIAEDEIVEAVAEAKDLEGLDICCASAVALASAKQLAAQGRVDRDEPVLVNLTGTDRSGGLVPTAIRYEDVR